MKGYFVGMLRNNGILKEIFITIKNILSIYSIYSKNIFIIQFLALYLHWNEL
jgi:hypothetical protein